jgi:hypothetical protein
LEEMEIAAVEESDLGVGAFEGLSGDEAAETTADDEDAMWRWHKGSLRNTLQPMARWRN